MHLIERNDQVERIFLPWRLPLGSAYEAYKGHVCRVLNFTCALLDQQDDDLNSYGKPQEIEDRIAVAACFHDVGIWLNKTMHYLDPSRAHAAQWLDERGLNDWAPEVDRMIEYHHKLSVYTSDHASLVEAFRRADLVDVTLGMQASGLPKPFVSSVKKAFPDHGVHWALAKGLSGYMVTHPWNPLPMMRK
ncbi:MAG: phosphohydrolase [Candidatus Hydrogenedentota bacterium]